MKTFKSLSFISAFSVVMRYCLKYLNNTNVTTHKEKFQDLSIGDLKIYLFRGLHLDTGRLPLILDYMKDILYRSARSLPSSRFAVVTRALAKLSKHCYVIATTHSVTILMRSATF